MLAFTDIITLICLLIIAFALISFILTFMFDHPKAVLIIFLCVVAAYIAEGLFFTK